METPGEDDDNSEQEGMDSPDREFQLLLEGIGLKTAKQQQGKKPFQNTMERYQHDLNSATQLSFPESGTDMRNAVVFLPMKDAEVRSMIEKSTVGGELPYLYPAQLNYPPQEEEHHSDTDLPMLPPLPFDPLHPTSIEQMVQREFHPEPHHPRIQVRRRRGA